MSDLKLFFFGSPRVELEGRPVEIRRRKALALLAYLAVTGQSHSRDTLATLFWPDHDQSRARAYLRRDLAALNKALSGAWIDADRESIGLNSEANIWLDVAQFHQLLAVCPTHDHLPDTVCPECLSSFTEAETLYQADFLAGFSLRDSPDFDEWQFFQAEGLRQELATTLERLVKGYSAQGEFETAIPHARRWLALDPLHEPAHRELMKLYAWAGQQAAALRQYEEGVRLLDEELGVTPEAETTALFEAIKTKRLPPPTAAAEPVSEASETEESSVFPPSQRSLPSIPRHNLPPLIGRAPQLATLDNLLTQVGQGSGQVVLVGGEAGIGKSRLVIEARHRADQQGWQTVQGDCFEPDVLFPYAPLIDLLRTSLTHRSVKAVTTLLGPLASEVVKLLPELALTLPDLTPTPLLDPEAEKRRLFETFVQFFLNLMQQDTEKDQHSGKSAGRIRPDSPPFPRPLLLIIEDLHWSDDTSLELLRYLARRLATQPLLLLLTYRSDELNPTLQHFLAALSREQRPVELTLPRFTPQEVDAFLRAIFEHKRPMRAEFLDALYNLTAGNPFFIEEVLKALMAAGDVFYSDGVWDRKPIDELRIPHSVQEAVQRRVAQLSEDAHRTLTVAAVIGQQFDFGVLQAVTEWPEVDLLAQLKELLATQLVVEVSAERFAFRHALTRQAIYSALLVRERQTRHQQIGETLERREADPSTSPSAGLAYHFYEAGAWEKALTYARRAGARAQALYTPRVAIEQFTRALQAAQRLEQTDLLPDLYRERGLAYETVGDFELARADLETVLQLVRTADDRQREWRTTLDLGKLWASRDYHQAGDYFQKALDLASTLDDPKVLARSLNRMGNWHLNFEAPRQALGYHEEALAIFQRLNDQPGLAQTFDLLGMTNLLGGDPVQGAAYYKQAIDLFKALDDRQRLTSSLTTLIICGPAYTTDTVVPATLTLAESVNWGKQAVQLAREIGWRAGEAYTSALAGQSLGARGRFGQALALMQRGFEIAQEIEHRQWICLVHRELGTLHFDLLALSTARQHLERSLALAEEIGSSFHKRRTSGYLISLLIVEQQFSQAETLLNAMGSLELPMQTLAQRSIWRGRVELALAQGDNALALQIVDQLFATATNTQNDDCGAIPYLAKLRGDALTALRRWSEAEDTLLAALATAQAQDTPRLVWRINVALGQLYQAQEQYAKAEQTFAAARAVIDNIATTVPDIELRNNFVRQAHAMMSPPKPSTPLQAAKLAHGGLTRRECEVAALVAEGKSNREIAETLVLGVRTVEGHVSNILGKLGFTSRTEIAVWAVEIGLQTNSE